MDDSDLQSNQLARGAGATANQDFLHRNFDDNEFRDKYGLANTPQLKREQQILGDKRVHMDFDDDF